MRARAWKYVTALVDAEYNTAQELLGIPDSWWEKHDALESRVGLIRASIGTDIAPPDTCQGESVYKPSRYDHTCDLFYVRRIRSRSADNAVPTVVAEI